MAKPLKWEDGIPMCVPCSQLYLNPAFVEAVYSSSIDRPHTPERIMKAAIHTFHEQGHKSI